MLLVNAAYRQDVLAWPLAFSRSNPSLLHVIVHVGSDVGDAQVQVRRPAAREVWGA